ncbi:TetR/AcrR family transcriptional regulator [Gordonia humi]|uniref:AcrR family transcriptional regulator n=1 Tax=Gordonia humi TaxID=686429 RepID=A0A840ETN8_9ACTN|nr:TetR/AcrR family transcriptional regulator [Gordonia humi]MBB4133704.1 AcrR family transcriptional regulator [Gordonia humi]
MTQQSTPRTAARAEEGSGTKSARTRSRILDAAAEVLSSKGYAGMRLTDVAKVAELQAPAIYYYFDSREALIEEVMWVGIADMRAHLSDVLEALPADTESLARIMAAVDAHLRHELQISSYTTASIRNSGQVPEHIRTRQLAEEGDYGRIWRELIKRAYDDGTIRRDLDLYMLQMLIMGTLNWAAEWWSPRRGSVDDVVRTAQAFVASALTQPQDGAPNADPVDSASRSAKKS